MKIVMFKGSTGQPWTGFLFKTDDGHIIAYDGGCRGDTETLLDSLELLTGSRTHMIDLWLISHPHGDHFGPFVQLVRRTNEGQEMPSAGLVAYYPVPDTFGFDETWCKDQLIEFNKAARECPWPKMRLMPGNVFYFGNVTVECLLVTDESEKNNPFNNASCVFKITEKRDGGHDFSLMLLGDLGVEGGERLLKCDLSVLKADAVQMSHHGQKGCTKAVYEAIHPRYAFWFTPDWLWNSEGSELSTVNNRKWINDMGAESFLPTDKSLYFETSDTGLVSFEP